MTLPFSPIKRVATWYHIVVEPNSYHLHYLPYYTLHGAFSGMYSLVGSPNDHSKRCGKFLAKDDWLCFCVKQDYSWSFADYGDRYTAIVGHHNPYTRVETSIKLNIRHVTHEMMYHCIQVLEHGLWHNEQLHKVVCFLICHWDHLDVGQHMLIFNPSKDGQLGCLCCIVNIYCSVHIAEPWHGLYKSNLHICAWEQWNLHDFASNFVHQNFHPLWRCLGIIHNYYGWHLFWVLRCFNYHWDFIFSQETCIIIVSHSAYVQRFVG